MGRKCFTLVELALVVAAVSLLLTLLAGAAGNAVQEGKAVACTANNKLLGAGMAAYNGDFDGFFPKSRLSPTAKIDNNYITWVYQMLKCKYIDLRALLCDEGEARLKDPWAIGKIKQLRKAAVSLPNHDAFFYSFRGYNYVGLGGGETGSGKMPKAAQVGGKIIVAADSWTTDNYNIKRYIGFSYIDPEFRPHGGLINPLHKQQAAVLWSDGHVTMEEGGDNPLTVWDNGIFADQANFIPED